MFVDGVRKLFPDSAEAAVVKDLSTWLSTARDRDGGRQKRAGPKTAAAEGQEDVQ